MGLLADSLPVSVLMLREQCTLLRPWGSVVLMLSLWRGMMKAESSLSMALTCGKGRQKDRECVYEGR